MKLRLLFSNKALLLNSNKAGIPQLKKYNEVMCGGYKLVLELY